MDHETVARAYEAMRTVVDGGRHKRKDLCRALWPDMLLSSGQAKLSAYLTPEKEEFFKLGEILQVQHLQGRYDYLQFEQDYLGHPQTKPLPPEDLEAALFHKIDQFESLQRHFGAEIDRLRDMIERRQAPVEPTRPVARFRVPTGSE